MKQDETLVVITKLNPSGRNRYSAHVLADNAALNSANLMELLDRLKEWLKQGVCPRCNTVFRKKRKDQKYCSRRCMLAACQSRYDQKKACQVGGRSSPAGM